MGCCWGREPGGEDAPRRGGRAPTDDLQLIVLVRDRRYGLITDGLQISQSISVGRAVGPHFALDCLGRVVETCNL